MRREDPADHQVAGIAGPAAVLAEVHGDHERDRETAELGRLKIEGAQIDPALRAELRRPPEKDEQQQADETEVEDQRMLGQHPVVERQKDEQGGEAEHERVGLRPHLRPRVTAVGSQHVRRAVDHRDPDAHDGQQRGQQRPVDVEEEASFEHYGFRVPAAGCRLPLALTAARLLVATQQTQRQSHSRPAPSAAAPASAVDALPASRSRCR